MGVAQAAALWPLPGARERKRPRSSCAAGRPAPHGEGDP